MLEAEIPGAQKVSDKRSPRWNKRGGSTVDKGGGFIVVEQDATQRPLFLGFNGEQNDA